MRKVLTDISLCEGDLIPGAEAKDIYSYIRALGGAGIRYVEINRRTLCKLGKLPRGIGYIFRVTEPEDLKLMKGHNFSYALIRYADLFKNIRPDIPVMLEMPFVERAYRQMTGYAQSRLGGRITAVRFRDDFGYKTMGEMKRFVAKIKSTMPLPVDFCPKDTEKTALDCAVKFTLSGADCISFTVPRTGRFASLKEYVLLLMMSYGIILDRFDMSEFSRAVVDSELVFNEEESCCKRQNVPYQSRIASINAETGKKVFIDPFFNDSFAGKTHFSSALEKMLEKANIDEETSAILVDAVKYYDIDICSDSVLYGKHKGITQ